MAWWNKVVSAAKSAVSKVTSAVKSVTEIITQPISKTISKVKTTVKKVVSYVKETVYKTIAKASSSVKKVVDIVKTSVKKKIDEAAEKQEEAKDYAKHEAEMAVEIASQKLIEAEDAGDEQEIKKREEEYKKIQEAEPTWTDKLLNILKSTFKIRMPFLGAPSFNLTGYIYEKITGKELTAEESIKLGKKSAEWMLSLNTYSKLFTGKNLDGKPEKFGTAEDYANIGADILVLGLFILTPGIPDEVGVKLGSKGIIKLFKTKPSAAVKLFKSLSLKGQTKVVRLLTKTDEGMLLINRLLRIKALKPILVKPTMKIIGKEMTSKILYGSGLGALVRKGFAPKTIAFGVAGITGIIGMAYGIPFGTSWMAKEGLDEILRFPLRDRIKEYKFDPTPEKLERIKRSIAQLEKSVPVAEALVKSVAWLWPPTKDEWGMYVENLKFELEEMRGEVEELEVIKDLPEEIEATVRDIIDGDTIDLSLEAINEETGESIKLPEYKNTGHARVRIVGINAPEKSPKGEILCTDIEIYDVEKKWADESRDRLLPLNDKKVILKTDPNNLIDGYNRILAVVEYDGVDIGKRQLWEGLACWYFRKPHKYVDDEEYKEETMNAKELGEGMWKGLEEIEKEEDKIKIYINSTPSNAKLYLDDVALHHNTPSDEGELSDVIHLFTVGSHILSAEKAGMSAMQDIVIVKGDNGTINLTLETAPVEEMVVEEEVPPIEVPPIEVPPEEVKEPPVEEIEKPETLAEAFERLVIDTFKLIVEVYTPVALTEIPEIYSAEQLWALTEAFSEIWELTKGKEIISAEEKKNLVIRFALYTEEQKKVLGLLFRDLAILTRGREQISTDEFEDLKLKYHIEEM